METTPDFLDTRPYDTASKELAQNNPRLLLRVAREIFHKDYPDDSKIEFLSTESIESDENNNKRSVMDDLCFSVIMEKSEKELCILEIQSTNDASIMMRTMKYAILTMMKQKEASQEDGEHKFIFPNIGIVFLRPPSQRILKEKFIFCFPNMKPFELSPCIMDAMAYSLESMKEKGLHFLVPFHVFSVEAKLKEMYKNKEDVSSFVEKFYNKISYAIREEIHRGTINLGEAVDIMNVTEYVMCGMEKSSPFISEGVKRVMNGKTLKVLTWRDEYEKDTKQIAERNKSEGKSEGMNDILEMLAKGDFQAVAEQVKQRNLDPKWAGMVFERMKLCAKSTAHPEQRV